MIIKGIEYAIRLFVMTEEDDCIAEEVFQNFTELNKYIDQTFILDAYEGVIGGITFVEVVNGIAEESGKYIYTLDSYLELEDSEIDDILADFDAFEKEMWDLAKDELENTKFIPIRQGTSEEIAKKKKHFADYSYICPHCFYELEECKCAFYPYYTVQIDKNLVPVIRELNNKGYRTLGCCSGHFDEDMHEHQTLSIVFADRYEFKTLPAGFRFRLSDNCLCMDYPENASIDQLYEIQNRAIEILYDWAKKLEDKGS